MKQTKLAFTLVELIVVITILAILATVWFISLTGYATESRDAKRISDISTLNKWLQVYQTRNSIVPEPSETKTILSSGSINLITQWYAGESVLWNIRVSDAKDPKDNVFYTYSTNANYTKYQLMGLLENNPTSQIETHTQQSYADYSNRYIYTKWQVVWVLTNLTNNTPIQELWNTTIDLQTDTTDYQVIFSTSIITTASWETLYTEIITQTNNQWSIVNEDTTPILTGWRALDPNCPIEDITIGTQTWAWCNSTLWTWIEYWQNVWDLEWEYNWTLSASYWCYWYDSIVWNDNSECILWSQMLSSTWSTKDYFEMKQWVWWTNSNWDREYDTIWWKLYTWNSITMWETDINWNIVSSDDDSICPTWRHIPSDLEFNTLITYLNWWTNCEATTWRQCDWLWWSSANWTKARSLADTLKIPLAGYRIYSRSIEFMRGRNTFLWSNTSSTPNAYVRGVNWDYSSVFRFDGDKNNAFSVRCIKD